VVPGWTRQVYVYVSVRRTGIVVLRFDPSASPKLQFVQRIQTANDPWGLVIRDNGGDKTLVTAEHEAGIRVYED